MGRVQKPSNTENPPKKFSNECGFMCVCVVDVGGGGGGESPPPDSHRRRRMFAGMKSLSVFGGRSGRGESPSARSISLPESRLLTLLSMPILFLARSSLKCNFVPSKVSTSAQCLSYPYLLCEYF